MGKTAENTSEDPEKKLLQEKIEQMENELKLAKEGKAEAEAKLEEINEKNRNAEAAEVEHAAMQEDERVTIKLFKDSKEYKDDLTVVVNGKAFKIQRGVEVSVPKYVAEVIEHSAAQDEKTDQLIEGLVAETEQTERSIR